MTTHPIGRLLSQLGTFTSHPAAFGLVILYAVLWILFDDGSLDWHGVAALATLLMTLVIQRSEHRDTQALQAKLDELLKVDEKARTELTQIDRREPEEIEEQREREQRQSPR
jgi:low affinity Fe/Cu permease